MGAQLSGTTLCASGKPDAEWDSHGTQSAYEALVVGALHTSQSPAAGAGLLM